MATQAQLIFKRILLYNKLSNEADLDALLERVPDPEQAIRLLVQQQVVNAKQATDLIAIYRKQLAQVTAQAAQAPAPAPTPAAQPPAAAGGAAVQAKAAAAKDMVLRLLKAARDAHASDLYIKSNHVPIGRIAGQLRDLKMPPIPAEACEQALIAILSDRHRKRFLETKDLDFCYDGGPELGRFRTSYLRHRGGVDGIFRLIPNRVPSLQELGLPDQVAKFTQYRQGIVIITGPKSSGKTTTLAAMVDLINSTRAEHIITIEDPIEFLHPCKKAHVNQREVGTHTESFHTALRAALREAPDVIMVGEMRDLETTSLAITAAETGHLVLATLHTPNAVRTIGRVLDVFPPKEQGQIRTMLSESLRGIVSQRLLPSADGRSLHLAIEILINTPAAGNLIREDKAFQLTSVMQTGKKLGMVLMDESLIRLAQEGKIAPEEAMQRADDPDFVQNSLMPQKKRR
jgi:twitching motility protein PilT